MFWSANYSACVADIVKQLFTSESVNVMDIYHYPLLSTSTSVNNCYLLKPAGRLIEKIILVLSLAMEISQLDQTIKSFCSWQLRKFRNKLEKPNSYINIKKR